VTDAAPTAPTGAPPVDAERMARYQGDVATDVRYATELALRYGPVTLHYRVESPDTLLRVSGPRVAFMTAPRGDADALVRCALGDVTPSPGLPNFTGVDAWEARRTDDGRDEVCYFDTSLRGRAPWARIRHDARLAEVEVALRPRWEGDRDWNVGFPTDEYITSRLLARRGGVVLHASSLVSDGRAYLFVGHSGAGKSTTAMNAASAGAQVLSDDRTIVVREQDGSYTAWGTPWHGSFRRATNASAPVAGLFIIVQAEEDVVIPITAARALGETFVRVVHPSPDVGEVEGTLDTLEGLVTTIPVGELRQRPTAAGFALACRFADRG
jgi:hypothetical protein